MSDTTRYKDAPAEIELLLEDAVEVQDFLPPPDKLIRKSEKEKITIAIDKHSLDLYRQYAKRHNAKYQSMINAVVGSYADKFLKK